MARVRRGGTTSGSASALGKHITEVRRRLGLSKSGFARRLGVSRNTLAHYEQGDRIPRGTILSRIAQAGDVSVDWLLKRRAIEGTLSAPA
jgi:transcriptional regulator with XRE-family HTH domain